MVSGVSSVAPRGSTTHSVVALLPAHENEEDGKQKGRGKKENGVCLALRIINRIWCLISCGRSPKCGARGILVPLSVISSVGVWSDCLLPITPGIGQAPPTGHSWCGSPM
jgi:hypothetical protein